MKTSEVLLNAKLYIKKHGWAQNAFVDEGAVCISEALVKGSGLGADITHKYDNPEYEQARQTLIRATQRVDPDPFPGSLIWWNDRPQRTKEQVNEAFEVAISMARAQEPDGVGA